MELFIKNTIKEAGGVVADLFGKVGLKYTKQDPSDIVSEADLASNRIIVQRIKDKFPSHGIIAEESGEHQIDSEYVWIIDPLDGSSNFANRIPLFGIMIGLAKDGIVELASIFDPVHDQLFFAQKGNGCYLNDEKIHCSNKKEWAHSYGCAGGRLSLGKISFLKNLLNEAEKELVWLNTNNSTAVSSMYVADGRRDWYYSAGCKVWDYAAPSLILSEAGCKVTNAKGENWRLGDKELAASNEFLHDKLLSIARM
ncbi:MAG: inositol monophosphatase family protein [bacterium]